jgi:hypothetical protein
MVELLFLCTLSRGMKDVVILPIGLGLRGVDHVTFRNQTMYLYYGKLYSLSTVSVGEVSTV